MRSALPRIPLCASAFLLTALLGVRIAGAAAWFVSQTHPHASDTNPGTEAAPFKTIQKGVDAAAAGDTVWVKAGIYREGVKVKKSGQYVSSRRQRFWPGRVLPTRVVLAAFGDDKVVVDGADPVPAASWQPLKDQPNVFVATVEPQALEEVFPVTQVFWKGRRLPMCLKQTEQGMTPAVPTRDDNNTWHYDAKTRLLHVNLAGANPRKEGPLEASVRWYGINMSHQQFVTLRGITFRRASHRGIIASRTAGLIIEDCEVSDTGLGIDMGFSHDSILRRCVVHDVDGIGVDIGNNRATLLCDNIVHSFFQDWRKTAAPFSSAAYLCFGGEFCRFYHNIALQPDAQPAEKRGNGFWPDVHGPGHFYVGNIAARCGTGFYIESPAIGNVVQWNSALDCSQAGIMLSVNALNVVAENYCARNHVALCLDGTSSELLDVAHNLFSRNWLHLNPLGILANPDPTGAAQQRNYAQGNLYQTPPQGNVALWAGTLYKTVEEFRKATGQESAGQETEINLADVGLVWVRVDGLDSSRRPLPFLGNPLCKRQSSLTPADPFFWRRGDAGGTDRYADDWDPSLVGGNHPYPGRGNFINAPASNLGAITLWGQLPAGSAKQLGNRFLHAASLPNQSIGPAGVGWWSPSLPVTGSALTEVGLWMRTEDVKPSTPDGGAVVYVEWSDWNGQNKSRTYIVGAEGGARLARPELVRGTHPWSEVRTTVIAPQNARRFALFMGGRSCAGRISFGAIHTLAVAGKATR